MRANLLDPKFQGNRILLPMISEPTQSSSMSPHGTLSADYVQKMQRETESFISIRSFASIRRIQHQQRQRAKIISSGSG